MPRQRGGQQRPGQCAAIVTYSVSFNDNCLAQLGPNGWFGERMSFPWRDL
ncbi:MAG: hypothetical protein IPP17_10310 [Bacteroidetes bacterium]|nr:hypothetical protein [Bacteroidota bacterium]